MNISRVARAALKAGVAAGTMALALGSNPLRAQDEGETREPGLRAPAGEAQQDREQPRLRSNPQPRFERPSGEDRSPRFERPSMDRPDRSMEMRPTYAPRPAPAIEQSAAATAQVAPPAATYGGARTGSYGADRSSSYGADRSQNYGAYAGRRGGDNRDDRRVENRPDNRGGGWMAPRDRNVGGAGSVAVPTPSGHRDGDRDRYGDWNRDTRNSAPRADYRSGHGESRYGSYSGYGYPTRYDRDDHRRWDRNSWRGDRRYDWYRYRAANRSIFTLGRYYAPYRDYSYSRVRIGFRLGSLFFTSRYWINDPWRYRLPEVYGPYRWIRYYDDALLVDVYSGEVVDVIYDFFW